MVYVCLIGLVLGYCDEQAGPERMCVDFMWGLLLKIERNRKKERERESRGTG